LGRSSGEVATFTDGEVISIVGGPEGWDSGRELLSRVAALAARLPDDDAAGELVFFVEACPDVTLRSPAFHEAMNALFEQGLDEVIRYVQASQLVRPPRGRPVDLQLELVAAVDRRCSDTKSSVTAAAKGLKPQLHMQPKSIENAYYRGKEFFDRWRNHVEPASALKDRPWHHPEWEYKATPVEAATDAQAAGLAACLEEAPELKREFVEAYARDACDAELESIVSVAIMLKKPSS
jgi:hypothetical protein